MTMIRFIHTVPAFTSNLCLSQTLCDAARLFTDVEDPYSLWGANAIPLALSIIRHVVHRPGCVICVHHNLKYQKKIQYQI